MQAKFRNGLDVLKKPSENKKRFKTGPQEAQGDSMSQALMESAAEHIAESAHQASHAASAIADAIEDGVGVVRHAAKRGGDVAEEFLNETTKRLQRHPALTLAATFAIGVSAGTMIGWIMRRR
jgi:hypothetical protein